MPAIFEPALELIAYALGGVLLAILPVLVAWGLLQIFENFRG